VARAESAMSAKETAWARHDAAWRDPGAVTSHWEEAANVDPALLRFRTRGDFRGVLEGLDVTLLVSREYEHLVVGLTVEDGRPLATFFRLPHPSGLVYDRERQVLHLASTRNPNQILELAPAKSSRALVPVSARFYPGRSYLHDLALIGGSLYANSVGQNLVVRVEDSGRLAPAWWPRCVDASGKPLTDRNHIQLNSIAAGRTLGESFFTASAAEIGPRKPGHRDFPVDGRGVVFSGRTREPIARGLTRPHSARLHEKRLYVANSGYGELGTVENGRFRAIARLPGWTRGLAFASSVAFAGTSRVIPRFSRYAPGLELSESRCALHALDARSGRILGSLEWPSGNQIFAIDWAPRRAVSGFPFGPRRRSGSKASRDFFYSFQLDGKAGP
jgi:uncharacterized protein (TIGR03032 family)